MKSPACGGHGSAILSTPPFTITFHLLLPGKPLCALMNPSPGLRFNSSSAFALFSSTKPPSPSSSDPTPSPLHHLPFPLPMVLPLPRCRSSILIVCWVSFSGALFLVNSGVEVVGVFNFRFTASRRRCVLYVRERCPRSWVSARRRDSSQQAEFTKGESRSPVLLNASENVYNLISIPNFSLLLSFFDL